MKILFVIVLIVLLSPVAFFIFAILANVFLLATGRMTKDELSKKVSDYRKSHSSKRSTRKRSSCDFLSYPSPLNEWSLWN